MVFNWVPQSYEEHIKEAKGYQLDIRNIHDSFSKKVDWLLWKDKWKALLEGEVIKVISHSKKYASSWITLMKILEVLWVLSNMIKSFPWFNRVHKVSFYDNIDIYFSKSIENSFSELFDFHWENLWHWWSCIHTHLAFYKIIQEIFWDNIQISIRVWNGSPYHTELIIKFSDTYIIFDIWWKQKVTLTNSSLEEIKNVWTLYEDIDTFLMFIKNIPQHRILSLFVFNGKRSIAEIKKEWEYLFTTFKNDWKTLFEWKIKQQNLALKTWDIKTILSFIMKNSEIIQWNSEIDNYFFEKLCQEFNYDDIYKICWLQ
jgi:hypothetical protein